MGEEVTLTGAQVALLRRVLSFVAMGGPHAEEAIDLLQALPDSDLVEARECVAQAYEDAGRADLAATTRAGHQDRRLRVQSALAALKRGREIGRG